MQRDWAVVAAGWAGLTGKGSSHFCGLHSAPALSAKALSPLLQLLLEPCFSPVALMRPWWSPVSVVLFLDPQTLASPASALTRLLTSSAVLMCPPTKPGLQACDFQTLPLSGPDCLPSSSQIFSWGLSPVLPPVRQSSYSKAFHPRRHSSLDPSSFRFLPEPPSHGGWGSSVCPALHPADSEVGKKRAREGDPVFCLTCFSHCPPFFCPVGSLSTH